MAMTPEERNKMERLERQVKDIQQVTDTKFVAELLRRIGGVKLTVEAGTLTGTTISVRNSTDTGSEVVADDYDGVINLSDANGNVYRIGYYT